MTGLSPRVSIGLPTYNRPELLALVLECFRQQTFEDFELIISDNASSNPEVQRLCERYVENDIRFRYVRQSVNLGAYGNFWFVYDQSQAPLFLWASDDDLWPRDFLEKGVAALDTNPQASAWFCNVINININGEFARSYPSSKRFQSTKLKFVDLARFLWEPEIMGKANLIYSIFRRRALSEVIDIYRERPPTWGDDMNIVYGFLCRSNIIIDDSIAMQKRLSTLTTAGATENPRSQIYPREDRDVYFRGYVLAAGRGRYWLWTAAVLAVRASYDYLASGRAAQDYERWQLRLDLADWGARTRHNFEEWKNHALQDFKAWRCLWVARIARIPHIRETWTWARLQAFIARICARLPKV